jgi:hypothetical protein
MGKEPERLSSILLLRKALQHVTKAARCATNFYCQPSEVHAKEVMNKLCFVSTAVGFASAIKLSTRFSDGF